MNKPLVFTAALMSAALVAGAAVDAGKIYHQFSRRQRLSSIAGKSNRVIRCGRSVRELPRIKKTCGNWSIKQKKTTGFKTSETCSRGRLSL